MRVTARARSPRLGVPPPSQPDYVKILFDILSASEVFRTRAYAGHEAENVQFFALLSIDFK